jgi:hypothetical protein
LVNLYQGYEMMEAARTSETLVNLYQGYEMMEAARTSETLVNLYQTTRRYNLKDSHLRTHRRENLKSYLVKYEVLHTAVFSILLSFLPSYVQTFSYVPCSQTPLTYVLSLHRETKFHTHTKVKGKIIALYRPILSVRF